MYKLLMLGVILGLSFGIFKIYKNKNQLISNMSETIAQS